MSFEPTLAESSPASQAVTEPVAASGPVTPSEAPQDVTPGGQRQSESVPYERFQQVNGQLSELREMARLSGFDNPREYVQALQDANAAQTQGYEEEGGEEQSETAQDFVSDYVAKQIFKEQFGAFAPRYPQADPSEVEQLLRYGQANGTEHAMRMNHQQNEAKRQRWLSDQQRTQQQRESAAVEGAGGGSTPSAVDFASMTREQRNKLSDDIKSGRAAPPGR